VRAIVAQHLEEPPLDLTIKPGEDAAIWSESLERPRLRRHMCAAPSAAASKRCRLRRR